jgi:hypothetical protein
VGAEPVMGFAEIVAIWTKQYDHLFKVYPITFFEWLQRNNNPVTIQKTEEGWF